MNASVVMEMTARKMFDHARTFSNAAYVLNRGVPDAPHNMQMDLVFPQSVCAALALELYFKTLYLLEKGVDFKNNKGKFSHDFHSLFGSLDKKTRDMVSFAFDKLIRQQDLSYVKTCSHFSNETGMEGNDFHCLEESVNIRTSRRRS